MTTRRSFLKGLALSAAAAAVPLKSERELHRQIYDDPVVQDRGFGLAPIKREGAAVSYDGPAYLTGDSNTGIYSVTNNGREELRVAVGGIDQCVLKPGTSKVFS